MVILLAAFASTIPLDVLAEQDSIDEIVVTATQRPARAEDVSQAVSVSDSEAMAVVKLVTDALVSMPGVAIQQTTPGQGAAIIRGLKGSSILHLVDGMRLNNAIFRSAPTQYLALVPRTAVDRIEVLRGTPASLYGSDAVGGVVQVVSRIPVFTSAQTEHHGEAHAAFDTANDERSIGATIDVGNRRIASSFSLDYLRTGDRRIGNGERVKPTGYESKAGRMAVAYSPDTTRSLRFDLQYLEQPETPRIDELVPGFGQSEPSSQEFLFAPNRRVYAHARYDRRSGPLGLDWRTSVAWQQIDDDRMSRGFGSPTRRFEENSSDLLGVLTTASRLNHDSSWIAGAEFYDDRVSSRRLEQDVASGQLQDVPSRFPDNSKVRHAAVFANAKRSLFDHQKLTAGLRLSTVRVTLPDTTVTETASVSTTDLSGDIGWIYRIGEDWQLAANMGFGFRAPNVFDLGTLGERPGNRFNIPNTDLDSENVLQGDIGLRHFSERWHLELVVYSLSYEDRITTVLTGDSTPDGRDISRSENASRSSIRGVEFATRAKLSDTATAVAMLNYARGTQRLNGIDEQADRVPPANGRVGVEIEIDDSLSLGGWVRFAAAQDRLSSRDVRDPRINPEGTAGWATLGALFHWQVTSGLRLSLGLDNILDKRYRVHGSGIDAPGRNLSLRIRNTW